MKNAVRLMVILFGLVCMAIATAHIVLGPESIPGSVPVNATMDSEDRFYATLFLGYGWALLWCARDLRTRMPVFGFLLLVFFLGGIARLISLAAVGPPNELFFALMLVELLLPPLLWLGAKRSFDEP